MTITLMSLSSRNSANEHGRGEAYTHQEREGGDGAAHHRPGMADAGQAGGNDSAGNAEPDQADCDSHGNHGSSRGVGPIAGPKSIFALSHPADADTPKRRSPHRLGYTRVTPRPLSRRQSYTQTLRRYPRKRLRSRCTPRTSKAAERILFLVVVSRSWALTFRSRNVRQVRVSCISLPAVGYTLVTPSRWGSDSSRCQI